MAGGIAFARPRRAGALISLVPMIDVMMILLVFFMVTSTYLNLDMIPAAGQRDAAAPAPSETPGETLMIRLGADGVPAIRGVGLTGDALGRYLGEVARRDPLAQVVVLPSGAAPTQALVSVMDAATAAGLRRFRVIRLEARP